MLRLTKGTVSQNIIVTLYERQVIVSPYFLFIFTHVTTKSVVSKIIATAAELSSFSSRYNEFAIPVSVLFLNSDEGFWKYQIYEQASAVNTNPVNASKLLETGILELLPATAFDTDEYNEVQTFKQYNG